MKYLKRYNESANQSYEEISKICKKYYIQNWSLNDEGLVDVDGHVNLRQHNLIRLPLKFGKVNGSFDCSINRLYSLNGSPYEVGGDFECMRNVLTSLEGAPRKVGGDFDCSRNQLKSLEGAPREVGDLFSCHGNKIFDFPYENGEFFWDGNLKFNFTYKVAEAGYIRNEHITNPIQQIYKLFGESKEKFFQSLDHHYFKGGNKIDKRRFYQALEEQGITPPDKIKFYIWA